MAPSALGQYLRSCRAAVRPDEFGLPSVGHRRVVGLRREEVALLAGMSVDYYVRLEQGRERGPSAQVLDALGDVFLLDEDGRSHLFRLAGLAPRVRVTRAAERVDPQLRLLMDGWPDNPVLVISRAYDVLARNQLGDALLHPVRRYDNLLLTVFLDPAARSFYADWRHAAVNTVAGFRLVCDVDPRAGELVRELGSRSAEFREMWARHDARGKSAETKTFVHPEVGEITLHMQTFDVRSSPGQQLVVYRAEPGTPSADALRLLGTIAATRTRSTGGTVDHG